MKSWTLIVSYLWRDTWSRWLEQPSNLLARLFVGGLLVVVATLILASFTVLERSVRARLDRFGLNTMIVRETIHGNDPEFALSVDRPDRLISLETDGNKLRLRQLFVRARTEWQKDILVMTYSPEMLPKLAAWMSPESPLVCLSDTLPENVQMSVTVDRQIGVAVVRQLPDFFRPLGVEDLLLIPQGWSSGAERIGYMETTLFERRPAVAPMQRYVEAVNLLYTLDRRPAPQVQSALPLLRELDDLKGRQTEWRILLAAILGLTVALVYGAISVLEFRQNLYVSALLRSLGTPARFLFLRQWVENATLANLAAIGGIALVATFHHDIFSALGFSAAVTDLKHGNPYWSGEVFMVLLCVNMGALLSTLPVAAGLRQPVGAVLN